MRHGAIRHIDGGLDVVAELGDVLSRRLDNKQRCDIGRRRRRLAEAGKVIFIAAVDVEQSAVIDWIIEQKRQWLVRKARKNDWLGSEEYRRFLVACGLPGHATTAQGIPASPRGRTRSIFPIIHAIAFILLHIMLLRLSDRRTLRRAAIQDGTSSIRLVLSWSQVYKRRYPA